MLTSFVMSGIRLLHRQIKVCTFVLLCLAASALECLSGMQPNASSPSHFSWRKELSAGPLEMYRIELGLDGRGMFYFKRRDQEPVTRELMINPSTAENLAGLFTRADFLDESKDFASQRKVADMGTKTVAYEIGGRKREVMYNYTEDRALQDIANFFENLCNQERTLFDIELGLKYDRLGLPKKLDDLERDFAAKRIVAPERFTEILEKISQDASLINLARKQAEKILKKIENASRAHN